MRLFRTPIWLHRVFPNYYWKIATQERVIYLSFDDGPDPEVTPFVLKCLSDYNAKATFFCVGENLEKNIELSENIVEEGHQIGNHTYHHLKGWNTPTQSYLDDVHLCQEKIGPISQSPLFRPPYGRIKKSQGRELLELGYRCVMWDILTYDYDKRLDVDHALRRITALTRKGSIVVFHDSQKAKKQLQQLLPSYLEEMTTKGFRFELIPVSHQQ